MLKVYGGLGDLNWSFSKSRARSVLQIYSFTNSFVYVELMLIDNMLYSILEFRINRVQSVNQKLNLYVNQSEL